MKKSVLFTLLIGLSVVARATVWNVEVGGGGGNGTPYYEPQNLVIDEGDEVLWTWVSGQHNVSQTSGPVFFFSGTKSAPATWSFVFDTPGVYTYECTIGSHAATQFGQITVNAANTIAEPTARLNQFQLYPNPADEQITLLAELDIPAGIRILDLSGRLVWQQSPAILSRQDIAVRDWKPGLYFVELFTSREAVRKKIVVR